MNDLLSSALWWASRGFKVFPCIPKSKAPATKTGFHAATLDPEKINGWWDDKDYNVGVSIPDGVIVVDFDSVVKEHLYESEDMHTPETLTVRTPGKGGGLHFFYRLPPGVVIPPRVGVMPGMDIRTAGSYVVAPPSEHPDGGLYHFEDVEWIQDVTIDKLPVCPAWVIEACVSANKEKDGDRVNLLSMVRGIEPGSRQLGLFRAACAMRARGLEKEVVEIVLESIAVASEASGYKKKPDIKALVDRVWRKYEGGRGQSGVDIIPLSDFMAKDLGNVQWFVDTLLAPGIAFCWSDPKCGKSQLLASLSLSVATREKVWGRYVVPRARGVLYMDLEQGQQAAQERWRRCLDGRLPPENLRVVFEWPRMDDGGLEKLRGTLRANPDIDMVVIDVISLFLPKGSQPGQNAYHQDYGTYDQIKKLSKEFGCLFIFVDHTSKSGDLTGSMGKKGIADYLLDLKREQGSSVGSLDVGGKNIESRKLIMDVDMEKFSWRVSGVVS